MSAQSRITWAFPAVAFRSDGVLTVVLGSGSGFGVVSGIGVAVPGCVGFGFGTPGCEQAARVKPTKTTTVEVICKMRDVVGEPNLR